MSAAAIFVKTPGQDRVKTRLARGIGRKAAEDFYLRSAATVAAVAQSAGCDQLYFAVAEPEGEGFPAWQTHERLIQPPGDLGVRMAGIMAELITRHGAGILLGADAPQITTRELSRARQWLAASEPRLVIGPAADGGFWLLGSNRAISSGYWQVGYSQADTADQLIDRMRPLGSWLTLSTLTDLDEVDDWTGVVSGLQAIERPHPLQAELLVWMRHFQ